VLNALFRRVLQASFKKWSGRGALPLTTRLVAFCFTFCHQKVKKRRPLGLQENIKIKTNDFHKLTSYRVTY